MTATRINQREIEAEQRKLKPEHQAFYVCYMSILHGPVVLGVFDTEEQAEAELPVLARTNINASPRPMFGGPGRMLHEYQVRTQDSIDKLAAACRATNLRNEQQYEG